MSANTRFFYLITMITTGVVAGVFFSEYIGIVPVLNNLGAQEYLHFKQGIIHSYNPAMPIIGISGTIAYIIWLVLLKKEKANPQVFKYALIGFLLLIASTLVTMFGELPANSQILTLNPAAPASNWQELRQLTTEVIAIRTLIMMFSFIVLTLASSYYNQVKS